jgi:hypothetical protein
MYQEYQGVRLGEIEANGADLRDDEAAIRRAGLELLHDTFASRVGQGAVKS